MRLIALALATFLSGLAAGFFYTYSISVMPGLADAQPEHAIAAMQGINRVVRNAWFALSFFGTPFVGLIAAVLQLIAWRGAVALTTLAAFLTYVGGVLVVTFLVNVPLNEALAPFAGTAEAARDIWASFVRPWNAWNDVRSLASAASFALFLTALVLEARRPG